MKKIPCFDLSEQTKELKSEIMRALSDVCDCTAFSGGSFVDRFEGEFAQFLGSSHFVGVSNGSDALFLTLRALGVGPGDEVIVPANTFIATVYAVQRVGATPVFADCDPYTWQIDPESVRSVLTQKTKGIIGVHLYGQMFPIREIMAIAKEADLFVMEDCAQSHGSTYDGQSAGTFGVAGCFSFYPAKNLGACGEGGGISCQDAALEDKIKMLRNQGSHIRYCHEDLGYNMRMDGFQAAILSVKLKRLAQWNDRRSQIHQAYRSNIQNANFTWQGELANTKPAWYLAVACVNDRERFLRYMQDENIFCGIHYAVPCHLQKAMSALGHKPGDFPHAEWQAAHCVSLPLFPELSDEDVQRVIDVCNRYPG